MTLKSELQGLKEALMLQFTVAAKYLVPNLYQQHYEKKAKAVFESLRPGSALTGLNDLVIQLHLREAGHDPETDTPYQEVLGLSGGRAEYECVLQSLASQDVEVVTSLKTPDSNGPE